MRLALAVRVCEVRQYPELSCHRLLSAGEALVLHRLRAGAPSGSEAVLGVGVLLPTSVPLEVRVACGPGPSRVRRSTSLAARPILEADEARHEPGRGSRRTMVVPGGASRRGDGGDVANQLGRRGGTVGFAAQRAGGREPGMG